MKNSIDFSVSLLHFNSEFAVKSRIAQILQLCPWTPLGWGLSADYLCALFRRMIGAFQGQETRGKCTPDVMHDFVGHRHI